MNTEDLLAISLDALDDLKAQNVQAFDTTPLTNLFERVIICNGTSNRQTRALANHVREKVNMGSVVAHIMQPTIRDYYRLEELWGAHPVDASVKKPAAKKAAAKRAPAKKAAVKAEGSDAAPAKKVAAKKVATKVVAVEAPVARKVAAKKAV
jgi:ribosome-associated protein